MEQGVMRDAKGIQIISNFNTLKHMRDAKGIEIISNEKQK
jgi:hypothetical protein